MPVKWPFPKALGNMVKGLSVRNPREETRWRLMTVEEQGVGSGGVLWVEITETEKNAKVWR